MTRGITLIGWVAKSKKILLTCIYYYYHFTTPQTKHSKRLLQFFLKITIFLLQNKNLCCLQLLSFMSSFYVDAW
jgi:hypothetical protein